MDQRVARRVDDERRPCGPRSWGGVKRKYSARPGLWPAASVSLWTGACSACAVLLTVAGCQDDTRLASPSNYQPGYIPGGAVHGAPVVPGGSTGDKSDTAGKGDNKDEKPNKGDGSWMPMDAGMPKDDHKDDEKAYDGPLFVEFQGPPQTEHKNGRTSVVVDIVVRTQNTSLAAEGFKVTLLQSPADRMLTDDDVLDVESWIEATDRAVSSNLNFQLVLDASFSMLQHKPPAFEPMKAAAAESIEAVQRAWDARGGEVTTGLSWFDEWIYHAQGQWTTGQLLDLEDPMKGTPTRLFGAAHFMALQMKEQFDHGVAAGERDRHVMLVFTDGKDNVSSLDSTQSLTPPCKGFCGEGTPAECQDGSLFPPCPNETTTGLCSPIGDPTATFRSYGYPCVDMPAVRHAFEAHPKLTVHVVGLGSSISKEELTSIADAGKGTAVFGADSGSIHDLFDEVLKQFVNIQTFGAHVPQSPGKYRFGLLVTTDGKSKEIPAAEILCSFVYDTESGFAGKIIGAGCSMK